MTSLWTTVWVRLFTVSVTTWSRRPPRRAGWGRRSPNTGWGSQHLLQFVVAARSRGKHACLVWQRFIGGAGRSSEVECSLMVRWVVGSILHGVDPLSYFSFQPVLHDWCNKGCGMCYPVCGMVHIKEPLLLIDKSSLCGGSGFPFSLSEWSLTICLMPYNRK